MVDLLEDVLQPEPSPSSKDADPATPPAQQCYICQASSVLTCNACAKTMCRSHAWTMMSICTQCAREDRMVRFHREAKPEASNWLQES